MKNTSRLYRFHPNEINHSHGREKGLALTGVIVFAFVASLFTAAVLQSLSVQSRLVQDDYNYTRALYLAESGLNRVSEAVWIGYRNANPLPSARINWLEANYQNFEETDASVGQEGDTYTVTARRIMLTGNTDERYVVFEATGNAAGGETGLTDRTITRVVRYGHDQSSIFDYTYFLNNFGWFWGGTITANGEVRANANFSLKYNPLVNGDIYASVNPDVGAAGTIDDQQGNGYRWWDLTQYRATAEDQYRPTQPEYKYGYDGDSEQFEYEDILEMPYLGDFARFEELAVQKNGTLSTADVNIVHSTGGPIFLFGTAANPIIIDGPVAIDGDVAIAGYIQGQGTIYTDRNVHIIGNIVYTDPPIYDHSEGADPAAVADHNLNADFLGLAARGNIILGDVTNVSDWYNKLKNYLKPPFTSPYTDEDGSTHSGDYTEVDGQKLDGSNRKRYESTWDDATFANMVQQAIAEMNMPNHRIGQIDALAYTNHIYTGRAEKTDFNGAVMSRDEAILYNNLVNLNYDYRAKAEGEFFIDIDLPKSANAEPFVWLEGDYEMWESKLDLLDAGLQGS